MTIGPCRIRIASNAAASFLATNRSRSCPSVNPPTVPGYDLEGPATLCLTNTGEAADGRVPNNPLDHVEDASSFHTGGVNGLMGDGSVRFIKNTINPFTWQAIGTRAGGEVLGDF